VSEVPQQEIVVELSGTALPAPFGPASCGMPDLSDLSYKTMLSYVLNTVLRGAGARDKAASAYLRGFILVTDKTIFEYENARAAFQAFIPTRNKRSVYFKTTWHLENCLHSARRALRFVERLRGSLGTVMPRADWRAIESHEQSICELRDLIEHMDDEIARDRITTEGYLIALAVTDDGNSAVVGDHTISFDRLAMLLQRLHALALLLADYHEPETSDSSDKVTS
jgi:hypothetical protein